MTPEEIATLAAIKATEKFEEMFEKLKAPEIQKVRIVEAPYDFSKPLNKRIGTGANTARPSEPTYRFQNPLDREVRLMGLSLIPENDAAKRAKVLFAIDLNEAPYDGCEAEFLTDISAYSVPIADAGHKIQPRQYIDVYLWSTDGTDVKVAVSGLLQARPQE